MKIIAPKGYEIDKENSTFDYIRFKKKDKPKRLDIVKGFYLDDTNQICIIKEPYSINTLDNQNIIPTEEEAKAFQILPYLLHQRDYYNGEPIDDWCDWTNANQDKYVINVAQNKLQSPHYINIKHLFSFKTEEIRDAFLEEFKEELEIAKPLL